MSNEKSKKIIIDARMLGVDNAGIGRAIEELVRNLAVADHTNEYYLFLTKKNFSFDNVNDEHQWLFKTNKKWHKVLVDVRWYGAQEQWRLPLAINKIKPDLVYFPHFNAPLFYRGDFVVTIHDLIWIKYPRARSEVSTLNPVFYFIKNLLSKIIFKSAVKRAKKVIVPTEFTKKDVIDFYKIDQSKIEVVNWGISKKEETPHCRLDIGESSDIFLKKCYNINKPYLLYVGSAYPHKNLEFLLKTFKQVKADLQLVLAGKDSYFYQKIKKLAVELELGDRVVFTDYVVDIRLKELYQQSLVVVYPSLLEGFGFPPLEAMINGKPVLSSNASCLPEVLGDAVLYFDPTSEEDLKNKILEIFNNQGLREDLVKKGLEQVRKYDWQKCAREYLEIFQDKF